MLKCCFCGITVHDTCNDIDISEISMRAHCGLHYVKCNKWPFIACKSIREDQEDRTSTNRLFRVCNFYRNYSCSNSDSCYECQKNFWLLDKTLLISTHYACYESSFALTHYVTIINNKIIGIYLSEAAMPFSVFLAILYWLVELHNSFQA